MTVGPSKRYLRHRLVAMFGVVFGLLVLAVLGEPGSGMPDSPAGDVLSAIPEAMLAVAAVVWLAPAEGRCEHMVQVLLTVAASAAAFVVSFWLFAYTAQADPAAAFTGWSWLRSQPFLSTLGAVGVSGALAWLAVTQSPLPLQPIRCLRKWVARAATPLLAWALFLLASLAVATAYAPAG